MAQSVSLWGATYSDVPALEVPKSGGGIALFADPSITTATESDVASGKTFLKADGSIGTGTASGGGGAVVVTETPDISGGTVKEITAVDISNDTVTAATLLYGYTAHDASGTAITGEYVEPTPRISTDVTVSGDTVTVPAGSYSSQVQKSVASGSATTPTTSITATPSISVSSSGLITASVSASESVTPTVSAGYVTSGTAGTVSVSGSNTSQLSTQAAATITPTTSSQTAVAAGKYTTGAVTVAAMPSGTAGTPTATKGTVTNHSVSITPSVTNTTGYITGSTKTGTAVTVSASELVSGSQNITSNNTYDVTNLASVVVNVSGGSGKNVQIAEGCNRATSSTYTDMGLNITVAKSGTYDVYWTGYRSSTSSGYTNGAQLYINGSAYGNAVTTFNTTSGLTNTQQAHLSNVSLSASDKLKLYARSRGNNYYMYVMDLIIIES